jgi:DNA-binding NarL/FixJ family response regulator
METHEAVSVIRDLADGRNPETHQELELTSICRTPLVVKALNRALTSLIAQYDRERNRPPNAFRHWTPPEDQQVCEELRQGLDFQQIAKTHSRTVGAIVARLVKLGKIASISSQKTEAEQKAA